MHALLLPLPATTVILSSSDLQDVLACRPSCPSTSPRIISILLTFFPDISVPYFGFFLRFSRYIYIENGIRCC